MSRPNTTDLIHASISPSSLAKLRAVVARLQDETRRGVVQSLEYAALKCAESGRSLTKPRRKVGLHRIETNPEFKQASTAFRWARRILRQGRAIPESAAAALREAGETHRYRIEKLHQQGYPTTYIYTHNKDDVRRQIKRWGLASKVFNVMVGKLGSRMETAQYGKQADRFAQGRAGVDRMQSRSKVRVRLYANLSYLDKRWPGAARSIVDRATAGINGYLDRKLQPALKRAA